MTAKHVVKRGSGRRTRAIDGGGAVAGAGALATVAALGSTADDATYSRGHQVADTDGVVVTFTTTVPGWYTPRTRHIHVRVHTGGQKADGTQSAASSSAASSSTAAPSAASSSTAAPSTAAPSTLRRPLFVVRSSSS